MSDNDTYQEKINADLDSIQEKLNVIKAQQAVLTADARQRHARQVQELEQKCIAARTRLREHGEADEEVWEQLRNGVEDLWSTLQCTLQDTVSSFEDDHSDPHKGA